MRISVTVGLARESAKAGLVVPVTRVGADSYAKALRGPLVSMVFVVLGCGPILPYRPGFLLMEPLVQPGKPPGAAAARRVGCLDVRMALACNAAVSPDFPLVAFTLGNRCNAAVPVDFARLRVTGRTDGPEGAADVMLSPFDPAREIHPGVLGLRAMAREVLEYDASPREATGRVTEVCIDLSRLSNGGVQGAPACLTRPAGACSGS
jgi:hypothetical protein